MSDRTPINARDLRARLSRDIPEIVKGLKEQRRDLRKIKAGLKLFRDVEVDIPEVAKSSEALSSALDVMIEEFDKISKELPEG